MIVTEASILFNDESELRRKEIMYNDGERERSAGGMNSFPRITKAAEKNVINDLSVAFRETMV